MYKAYRIKLRSSLVLGGYAHTRGLPLHTPSGPREDTRQLVVDASWCGSKLATYICRTVRGIRQQQSTCHNHETKPHIYINYIVWGAGVLPMSNPAANVMCSCVCISVLMCSEPMQTCHMITRETIQVIHVRAKVSCKAPSHGS